MRTFEITARLRDGQTITVNAIASNTVAAMLAVIRNLGDMPTRIVGRAA